MRMIVFLGRLNLRFSGETTPGKVASSP